MNPIVLPASTLTTVGTGAGIATPVAMILVWVSKTFWKIDIPPDIYLAFVGVFSAIGAAVACHFTTDNPPAHPAPTASMAAITDRRSSIPRRKTTIGVLVVGMTERRAAIKPRRKADAS